MARGYLIFGDIKGKLDVLRVECTKCERKGRYSVVRLIENNSGRAWQEPNSLPLPGSTEQQPMMLETVCFMAYY
jgi:hypothetical protein